MVWPRGSHDLNTLSKSLTFSPAAQVNWTTDVFDNLIATASFKVPASELVITSELTVEQSAAAWPVFQIALDAHSYPFAYSPDDLTDIGAFLRPAPRIQESVASWSKRFVRSNPTDTLSLLKDINSGILGNVAYRTRDEEGTQTAKETLEKSSGSCRDIAELFIEAVRHLGFGARAVSGYLYDPAVRPNDPGATHAWAEVYLPSAGWIAFDPTHQRVGESNLIPVAVARSNRQIMPVTGAYTGAPNAFVGMEVDVRVVLDA